jgi:hypothetical protein
VWWPVGRSNGTPYLVPEIVLLFKAKHDRPKDNADFAEVLPLLDPNSGWPTRWLVYTPDTGGFRLCKDTCLPA